MQIIKNSVPWWVGKTLTCGRCGAVGRLEASDPPPRMSAMHGVMRLFVACPECGRAGTELDCMTYAYIDEVRHRIGI